jgi:hypothetical protein
MNNVLTSSSSPSRFSGWNRCISCPISVSSPLRGCSSEVWVGSILSLWVLNGSSRLLLFMLLGLLRVSIEEEINLLHDNKTLCRQTSD